MPWFSHFEGTIYFKKQVLSVEKQALCINTSKSLSFACILLIFSKQIIVLQPPLQPTLTYVHQALQEALQPYGIFLIGRITFTVWESNSWEKKKTTTLSQEEDTFHRLLQFTQKALPWQRAHAIFRMNMHPATKSKPEYLFSLLV